MIEDDDAPAPPERFMPDWVLGLAARLALVPGLWQWARTHAGSFPGVDRGALVAAERWTPDVLPAEALASTVVWGAHILVILLLTGFLTRIVGLGLVAASLIYMSWIAPEAWTSALPVVVLSFYLFARGGGGASVDGALVASTR